MARLKKAVMLYVAQLIPEKEVENIRQVFTNMDNDGNGVISKEEFQKGISSHENAKLNDAFLKAFHHSS